MRAWTAGDASSTVVYESAARSPSKSENPPIAIRPSGRCCRYSKPQRAPIAQGTTRSAIGAVATMCSRFVRTLGA